LKVRDGVFVEGLFVGATTLAIGSALMLVPSKSKAWPFVGTFLLGFLTHVGYEAVGLNEKFADRMLSD
jgi:hypothetical protein|tara:strand:+ start:315 stop:518 length:204 start_codon:yes stop_codon:yes gene_type:complete